MHHHVLVIEDDHDIRQMLRVVLELSSFKVTLARNGQEGLELLMHGDRPHVIVLDLMMPILSGWEFRERQLADPAIAGIPVLVLSGGSPSPEALGKLGDAQFLEKPVDIDRLIDAVQGVLGSSSLPR